MSGYVLAMAYGGRELGTLEFLKIRLRRIWPGHAVVLAVMAMLAVAGLLPANLINWRALGENLLLIQSWGYSRNDFLAWNSPAWTLSGLVVCYAAFPTIWRALDRLGRPRAVLLLAIACYAVLAIGVRRAGYDLTTNLRWVAPVRCLPLFLLGVCLQRAVHKLSVPRFTFVARLGELSWAIYLTHYLFGVVAVPLIGPGAAVALSLPLAWVFSTFIDAPLRALNVRDLLHRTAAALAGANFAARERSKAVLP
jgi:peptidoglycan/LPS O-acetylase OafA/YrhL